MGFSKINAMSLTDLFVQQVENMILSGELNIGEQLPSARELCVKMGVSRPVISAGIVELEKMGLCRDSPPKGRIRQRLPS
jgi:DNA-binding FadR family transcriptional regulator